MTYTYSPPYESVREREVAHGRPLTRLGPGTLILIRPLPGVEAASLAGCIDGAQRAAAPYAIVLWLDLVTREEVVRFTAAAARLQVRAVVSRGSPDPDVLRRQLTTPESLDEAVSRWLELRGFGMAAPMPAFVRAALDASGDCRTISESATRAGVTAKQWRAAVRRAGFAHAEPFFQVLRLLAVGVAVQRDPTASQERTAERYGFHDGAALRRRFQEVFGCGIREVRQFLGWEWMLWHGLRRAGLVVPVHGERVDTV